MLDLSAIKTILQEAKTIAVVGAKDKPGHPVDGVGRYLIRVGYQVIPVHPVRKEVWGLPAYPRIQDVPKAIDVLDIFRRSEFCPEHAREVLELQRPPLLFWMQEGISNQEVHSILHRTSVTIVEDHCLLKVHKELFGESDART